MRRKGALVSWGAIVGGCDAVLFEELVALCDVREGSVEPEGTRGVEGLL